MQINGHTVEVQERRTASLAAYASNRRAAGKSYFSRRVTKLLRNLSKCPRIISSAVHKRISAGAKRRWAEGRGLVCTMSLAKKRSKNAKRQWLVKRDEMLRALKTACNKPKYKRLRPKIQKRRWVEKRTELCTGLKRGHNTPEARANHSNANFRRYAAFTR